MARRVTWRMPRPNLRWLAKVAMATSPALILLLVDQFLPWTDPLPPIYVPQKDTLADAGNVLNDLSSFEATLAGGLMVGASLLGQQTKLGKRAVNVGIAGALLCGFLSLYCGFRFKLDLAAQLADFGFDLRLIGDRQRWQSYFLVGTACFLFYAYLESLIGPKRDKP